MYFESKKMSLVLLGITAIACSKILFLLFNDPEGANLLIVVGMALFIYLLSVPIYLFDLSLTRIKGFLVAISVQILIVASFYFGLS